MYRVAESRILGGGVPCFFEFGRYLNYTPPKKIATSTVLKNILSDRRISPLMPGGLTVKEFLVLLFFAHS